MLTAKQLGDKVCLSAHTVEALLDAKVLPFVTRDGERYVRIEDFEAFVATCPVSEWVTGEQYQEGS